MSLHRTSCHKKSLRHALISLAVWLGAAAALSADPVAAPVVLPVVPAAIPVVAAPPPRLTVLDGTPGAATSAALPHTDILSHYDFGSVALLKTARLEHVFMLRNDTDIPLTLTRLQPSCGCTTAALTAGSRPGATVDGADLALPVTLAPRGRVQMHVSIDPDRLSPGQFAKSVTLFAQGQDAPAALLEMSGTLDAGVMVSPSSLDFGAVPPGHTRALRLTLTLDPSLLPTPPVPGTVPPPSPLQVASSDPDVIAILDPSAPADPQGRTQTYTITASSSAHLGDIGGSLMILTTAPSGGRGKLLATVPMHGQTAGDISALPSVINFGTIRVGQGATQHVIVTAHVPLQSLKIYSAYKSISARLTDAAGRCVADTSDFSPGQTLPMLGTGVVVAASHKGQDVPPQQLELSVSVTPQARAGEVCTQILLFYGQEWELTLPVTVITR